MTPERWEHVCEVLEATLSLQSDDRERYLAEVCANDPGLRREVDSLLTSHDAAGSQFLNIAALSPGERQEAPRHAGARLGRRIGPYLIAEEVGHGGMGEVYAAVRADGQYEMRVALKLVRAGFDTQSVTGRFHQERQILAALDHPNIARLMDGGTTEDGVPYLVMELVEGSPVDAYCSAKKLSINDRLRLFLQICSAVQYAHRHLVIHRDIKPGNILVTREGTPKLLDFGIAKIVDTSGNAGATVLRPMTPEFASPEQVRGDPITTATDVYSLGVVLYELLTGSSPYRETSNTPPNLAHAIVNDDPERPSSRVRRSATRSALPNASGAPAAGAGCGLEEPPLRLQRQLRGDLDWILLKALRKEPGKRYPSVEEFSGDIRRHLEGLPITARKGTWSYRAGKFVRRNRIAVAAAALILLALVTGVIVTAHQARIAEFNRRRAEARFNDVRNLANSLIFEVHDSIRDLPGATAARKLIIQRAQEYLDSLAREAGEDLALQQELAAAYERLGDVRGNPSAANLGETAGALESYQKAVALREWIAERERNSADSQKHLAVVFQKLSSALIASGDYAGGAQYARENLGIVERLAAVTPGAETQEYLAGAFYQLGWCQMDLGDFENALINLQRSATIRETLMQSDPKLSPRVKVRLAGTYGRIASVLAHQGQPEQAVDRFRKSAGILESLSASDPLNATYRQYLNECFYFIGFYLNQAGQPKAALQSYLQGLAGFEAISAADPKEARAKRLIALSRRQIGRVQIHRGQWTLGTNNIRTALHLSEELYRHDPGQKSDKLPDVADAYAALAEAYASASALPAGSPASRVANRKKSCSAYKKSSELWREAGRLGAISAVDLDASKQVAQQLASCQANLSGSGKPAS